MDKIIFRAPFNSLSFGNVSYNLARELYARDIKASIFPIGQNFDFSAFDKIDEDFKKWIESCTNNRLTSIDKDIPYILVSGYYDNINEQESKEILQAASDEVNDWLKKASSGWGQFWKKEYEEMTQQSEGSMTPPESTETDI